MRFWIYRDNTGYWRWTLYAANNQKVADSGESYTTKANCLHGIALVKGSTDAPVFER